MATIEELSAATDLARNKWTETRRLLREAQRVVEEAQIACNRAEHEYYNAEDREIDAVNAAAEQTGQ